MFAGQLNSNCEVFVSTICQRVSEVTQLVHKCGLLLNFLNFFFLSIYLYVPAVTLSSFSFIIKNNIWFSFLRFLLFDGVGFCFQIIHYVLKNWRGEKKKSSFILFTFNWHQLYGRLRSDRKGILWEAREEETVLPVYKMISTSNALSLYVVIMTQIFSVWASFILDITLDVWCIVQRQLVTFLPKRYVIQTIVLFKNQLLLFLPFSDCIFVISMFNMLKSLSCIFWGAFCNFYEHCMIWRTLVPSW